MYKDIEKYAASIKGVNYGQISAYQAARQSGRQSGKSLVSLDMAYERAKAQSDELLRRREAHQKLRDDGWLPVKCSEYFFKHWSQCHDRCREMFGKNYTWTGDIFWFKTEEDIMIFKLTFGA
jgi:hypothetical protein